MSLTILADTTNAARSAQEEISGPVVTVILSEAETAAIANVSRFGLAGPVWTTHVGRAHRMADAMPADALMASLSAHPRIGRVVASVSSADAALVALKCHDIAETARLYPEPGRPSATLLFARWDLPGWRVGWRLCRGQRAIGRGPLRSHRDAGAPL